MTSAASYARSPLGISKTSLIQRSSAPDRSPDPGTSDRDSDRVFLKQAEPVVTPSLRLDLTGSPLRVQIHTRRDRLSPASASLCTNADEESHGASHTRHFRTARHPSALYLTAPALPVRIPDGLLLDLEFRDAPFPGAAFLVTMFPSPLPRRTISSPDVGPIPDRQRKALTHCPFRPSPIGKTASTCLVPMQYKSLLVLRFETFLRSAQTNLGHLCPRENQRSARDREKRDGVIHRGNG